VVAEAAETIGIHDYNPTDYEAQSVALNISVDDIGVTFQNPNRPFEPGAPVYPKQRHAGLSWTKKCQRSG
jgi:hypothetical protein